MSLASSFTSYWGNALMGIYVTWENSATSSAGPVTAGTTKLKATFDLNFYAAGTTTLYGTTYLADTNPWYFYLNILNPQDQFVADVANVAENTKLGFDGLLVNFTVEKTAGGDGIAPASQNVVEFRGTNPTMNDMWCQNTISEGQYDVAKCFPDIDSTNDTGAPKSAGVQDWTNLTEATNALTTQNYCTEFWAVAWVTDAATPAYEYGTRCVKVQIIGERFFQTQDNGTPPLYADTHDIDLSYRKYSMTTGWAFSPQGTLAT